MSDKLLIVSIGTQVMLITGNVFNLLVMINCAANFILYSAFSTKFRATFSRLFCACHVAPPSSSVSGRGASGRRCDVDQTAGRSTASSTVTADMYNVTDDQRVTQPAIDNTIIDDLNITSL